MKPKRHHYARNIAIIIALVAVVGAGIYAVSLKTLMPASDTPLGQEQAANASPARIKSMPLKLAAYDPATGKAGDLQFTKATFANNTIPPFIFIEYGYAIPASSAGPARRNPQPTFIAPLGTKVRSLVDGEVVNVPKLYSNDFSIHVQAPGSDLVFETEHVIKVQVKVGDKVRAGQVIAEVSDYDARNYAGLGLVEIGVLKPGNPPSHECTFDYLDETIKDETLRTLEQLKKSWETYRGNTAIYDEAAAVMPGCLTREPVEG